MLKNTGWNSLFESLLHQHSVLEWITLLSNVCFQYFIFSIFFFKILFIYFLERGQGREKGREISLWGCLLPACDWGPGPQPRHVPWLGIKLVTFWFSGQSYIHWATRPGLLVYILSTCCSHSPDHFSCIDMCSCLYLLDILIGFSSQIK